VPVAIAIGLGERLVIQAWIAIAMALASALLISFVRREGVVHISAQTVVLSIVSGVTLGLSLVALSTPPADSGINVAVVEIVGGAVLLALLMLANRSSSGIRRALSVLDQSSHEGRMPSRRQAIALSAWAGVLLAGGNSLAVIALHSGSLAVVAVIIGLYPLSTIVLARIFYHEKLSPLQLAGVGLGLAASVILALS
jgi:drug/metabolite transporter (DMT)-like permease